MHGKCALLGIKSASNPLSGRSQGQLVDIKIVEFGDILLIGKETYSRISDAESKATLFCWCLLDQENAESS
ncbi:hypothetical protein Tco_1513622 [Tanacetum coccineum]